ncbi:polyketide cyclase [Labrys wisconsinensis]|uniref:Polyketide cyclase n=1 Tax=Labrys wisconsinensis TaxID=425677 RepID=A0ABU0JHI1_9HYPH|nr:polyketide cyclase [Labrys wisconsinensis]MDQ0472694.1 hypothetical protein [Labrys wisconsinensis]
MFEAQTIGISIDRPWQAVYEAVWRPQDFPKWASGLSRSSLEPDGEAWKAEGPEGPIRIRFTAHNGFGVMDHWVETGAGPDVYVPMRIIANGAAAEAVLTLFRQPGMSEETFRRDADWVRRDLAALKALVSG